MKLSQSKLRTWSRKLRTITPYCEICHSTDHLQAHHINDKSNHPDQAYDLDNGIVLCNGVTTGFKCHQVFHTLFKGGYRRKCTRIDLEHFLQLIEWAHHLPNRE